jgi:hypothetical protein
MLPAPAAGATGGAKAGLASAGGEGLSMIGGSITASGPGNGSAELGEGLEGAMEAVLGEGNGLGLGLVLRGAADGIDSLNMGLGSCAGLRMGFGLGAALEAWAPGRTFAAMDVDCVELGAGTAFGCAGGVDDDQSTTAGLGGDASTGGRSARGWNLGPV